MIHILRWLFGITVFKLIKLKEGDCLLVTTPEESPLSKQQLASIRKTFEHYVGKRVIVAEPGFDLTVIRAPINQLS